MFRDKLKNLVNKNDNENEEKDLKSEKKKIENLVVFIVILIITVVVINVIWNGDKKDTDIRELKENSSKKLASTLNENMDEVSSLDEDDLEKKLKSILSKISGVGNVDVCINYSESSEVVALYNENTKTNNTEETDTSGGTRRIEENDLQKEIVYKEEGGEKVPIITKVVKPKIEGAIITAKGANNAAIRANIVQAVEALTGLATHKIQVFEMN